MQKHLDALSKQKKQKKLAPGQIFQLKKCITKANEVVPGAAKAAGKKAAAKKDNLAKKATKAAEDKCTVALQTTPLPPTGAVPKDMTASCLPCVQKHLNADGMIDMI